MVQTTRATTRTELIINGCEAIAHACRLADIDFVTAYPIRPYDGVMEAIARMIANGDLDADYIVADSEHSQFEMAKHASAVGARAFVGSSGVGWLHAYEAIAVTAGLRLPVVAMVGNRALDDPGAFGVEHNDALSVRDLGWMLTWVDSAQEALDTVLIAYRVAEDHGVFLPCAVAVDGAFLTHSEHLVTIPAREQVERFVPRYNRGGFVLHPDNPITIAPQVDENWLMEIRKQSDEAMRRARGVIASAYAEFAPVFGRDLGNPFIEEYMTDDAEVVLVGQGTLSTPVKAGIRQLREGGQKVGFVRLKWLRPFPTEEMQTSLSRFRAVGVIDRDYSFGSPYSGGVLFNEIRSALYPTGGALAPPVIGFTCGLGGREVTLKDVREMSEILLRTGRGGKEQQATYWIGVRA
ncbi:MAG: pyruvate ferredoxin oxidoreductase [Chloroflexi bacterium]|nr:pyruvate ferredoxin oxidoreductase [Chloroflexota bacterium]